MEIAFTHPEYLWALLIIPVLLALHFIFFRSEKTMALKFANFAAISRISGGIGQVSNVYLLSFKTIALLCTILSISGMTLWYVGETIDKDYVLVIDASSSMALQDFYPNRLEAAKTSAINFVDSAPFGSRIGVVSFSGVSFVEQTLTADKSLVKDSIEKIDLKEIGGTDIESAIITGTNLLLPSKKTRVIVLLTDGRSNVGVSENTAILYAMTNHIIIDVIGIGASETEKDSLDLGINEELLNKIANLTLGNYNYVQKDEDLNQVYEKIVKSKSFGQNPFDPSLILLLIASSLLFLDWFAGNTVYKKIP